MKTFVADDDDDDENDNDDDDENDDDGDSDDDNEESKTATVTTMECEMSARNIKNPQRFLMGQVLAEQLQLCHSRLLFSDVAACNL